MTGQQTSLATPEAMHRQSRAQVARALIKLYENNELDEPGQWTWQRLDEMPMWCILQPDERRKYQLLCGLLLDAPAVARWIDGRCIKTLHELLGESLVERVLEETLMLDQSDSAVTGMAEYGDAPPTDAVEAHLLNAGGSVLRSSLDPSLPVARLADSLEDAELDIPLAVAKAILNRAHALQQGSSVTRCSVDEIDQLSGSDEPVSAHESSTRPRETYS